MPLPAVQHARPSFIARQRAWVTRLTELAARRQAEGETSAARQQARNLEARQQYQRLRDDAALAFERQFTALAAEYRAAREAVYSPYETEGHRLAVEEASRYAEAQQAMAGTIEAAKTLRQHRTREILKAYRDQKEVPKHEYVRFKQQCLATAAEIDALVARARAIVTRRCPWPEAEESASAIDPPRQGLTRQVYLDYFTAAYGQATHRLAEIQNQPAAKFIEDGWPLLLALFALVLMAYPAWLLGSKAHWIAGLAAWLLVPAAVYLTAWLAARPSARRQTLRAVPGLKAAVAEARAYLAAAVEAARLAGEAAHRQLRERRDADLAAARAEYKQARREAKARHLAITAQTEEECAERRKAVEVRYETQLDALEAQHRRRIANCEQALLQRIESLAQEVRRQEAESRAAALREQQDVNAQWAAALAEFEQEAALARERCANRFPPWEQIAAEQIAERWAANGHPAALDIDLLPLGRFELTFPAGALQPPAAPAAAVAVEPAHYELPAVLVFPDRPSLLIEAEGAGRDAATRVLQNAMLRFLTAYPPGKVRFTIIDPVGLGQNFSAFMHLADYDEKLVGSRIWTEAAQIQRRLADLTEHMENVIQKYLRNEFASIQEYNEQAGEVAEPLEILVVANFPANFSDEAARRLASIAASGARCGVYTLISTDTRQALPRNFELADLAAQAATLVWNPDKRRFVWKDDVLAALPLVLEEPPAEERVTEVIRAVGQLAKDAARVEVPFDMVTPAGPWWTGDSRGGVEVPLGRAGAKNLQYLRLGKGTSQHVLVSGKTGSGKSTLLNALITNLALYYSPDELEFYLIDFKKGVEFKAYATARLPHARVIAIESEREFGLSVLERLDLELKRRGDLFRQAGVQDLGGYRQAVAGAVVPRALLIIDEFQEFFTSDDRIAHDAGLLLDRLVRQGRAFGIHVLLGSQTLAGAYSLARSTLGQMAVRIALQCSEADAHLILSEDNSAARLLSRPGEAIYNDANGLVEGNHPFQIVWLPDDQREHYLQRVTRLAAERHVTAPPPIVFEGSAAADPRENRLLAQALESPPAGRRPAALRAWLGSAVAIKEPTCAVFRPQGGSNLLIVGQRDELALGMLAVSLISLAAQLRPLANHLVAGAIASDSPPVFQRFYVLDGTRPDAPEAGFWPRLARHAAFGAAIVAPREAAQTIGHLADEVNRRLASGDQSAEPVFLLISNLARFRELKKSDEYGFDDEGAAAAKQLATMVREGPAVGVHTLLWCDTYTTASRWLDRQTLRDFEMRVLFQMSATDSSNLMDSPAASRLGSHAALFYSEEHAQAEKFRPYGVPDEEWLSLLAERLRCRGGGESG